MTSVGKRNVIGVRLWAGGWLWFLLARAVRFHHPVHGVAWTSVYGWPVLPCVLMDRKLQDVAGWPQCERGFALKLREEGGEHFWGAVGRIPVTWMAGTTTSAIS